MTLPYETAVTVLNDLLYTGGRGRITPEALRDAVKDITDALRAEVAANGAEDAAIRSDLDDLLAMGGIDDGEYTPSEGGGPPSSLVIGGANITALTVGQSFMYALGTNRGGNFVWDNVGGTIPSGLLFEPHPSGGYWIHGTPLGPPGNFSFTIRVRDTATNEEATRTYSGVVNTLPLLTVTPNSGALNAITGPGFYTSQTCTITGGVGGPGSYHVVPSQTPLGLTINSTNVTTLGTFTIEGYPVKTGTNLPCTVIVEDGNTPPNFLVTTCTITIDASAAPLTISYPFGTVSNGQTISVAPTVGGGGTGALTFTQVDTIPFGLVLNPTTGVLSGTLSGSGVSSFRIAVTAAGNHLGGISTINLTVNA